jgi:hypothetical protein
VKFGRWVDNIPNGRKMEEKKENYQTQFGEVWGLGTVLWKKEKIGKSYISDRGESSLELLLSS